MSPDRNPLDTLNLETERVLFVLYGWKRPDGTLADKPYFKLAHSFAEAYGDLLANPAVKDGLYIVNDIFVELPSEGEEAPTLHIELRDLADIDGEG